MLNRVIRLARVERSDNGDVATVTIQAKAQAGERELNTAAVAIGVQFATVDGAGPGVGLAQTRLAVHPVVGEFFNQRPSRCGFRGRRMSWLGLSCGRTITA